MTDFPIYLHGNNFDSNRGCQALRISTDMILRRVLPDCEQVHANIFCNTSPEFLQTLQDTGARQLFEVKKERNLAFYLWGTNLVGCRFWHLPTPMRIIREIRGRVRAGKSGVLMALGGDNFSLDYGSLALHLFTEPFTAAVRLGFPTVLWGGSIGPFGARPRVERRLAKMLRAVDLITVRESLTYEYLESLGCRNLRRVSDPAFILPRSRPEGLPEPLLRALDDGAVGLNLAPLLARYVRKSPEAWRDVAREVLCGVLRRVECPLVAVPHVVMEPEVFPNNNDQQFMAALIDALPARLRDRVQLLDISNLDCTQIKWVISRLRAFAGCRTHATIAALSSGVPTFCIGYSVKSRGIFRDIFGHEDHCDHFTNLLGDRLGERFADLLDHEAEIRTHLERVMPQYAQRAWDGGTYLSEMLG